MVPSFPSPARIVPEQPTNRIESSPAASTSAIVRPGRAIECHRLHRANIGGGLVGPQIDQVVALTGGVRRRECVAKKCGSSPALAI
jgi:hypothetical protein